MLSAVTVVGAAIKPLSRLPSTVINTAINVSASSGGITFNKFAVDVTGFAVGIVETVTLHLAPSFVKSDSYDFNSNKEVGNFIGQFLVFGSRRFSGPQQRPVLMGTNGRTVTISPGPVVPSTNIQEIHGNRNGHLSGSTHPNTDVPFDADGFPNFSKHLYKGGANDVMIKPTKSRLGDEAAANTAAGYSSTPKGYTWHHHQQPGRMQLVERGVHRKTGHTGGWSIWGE